jgi:UDP-2,4-diacetamido-2,4,6-trideoxy-beta-L-altropyranose hydrolase
MSVQVRKIESRDIEFLWYLRNRPDVYRLFSTPRPVSWEEHVEWVMPYMLGLKEGDLFVIEFEGTSVGQVRIDYNENEGVMSISVLSDFR